MPPLRPYHWLASQVAPARGEPAGRAVPAGKVVATPRGPSLLCCAVHAVRRTRTAMPSSGTRTAMSSSGTQEQAVACDRSARCAVTCCDVLCRAVCSLRSSFFVTARAPADDLVDGTRGGGDTELVACTWARHVDGPDAYGCGEICRAASAHHLKYTDLSTSSCWCSGSDGNCILPLLLCLCRWWLAGGGRQFYTAPSLHCPTVTADALMPRAPYGTGQAPKRTAPHIHALRIEMRALLVADPDYLNFVPPHLLPYSIHGQHNTNCTLSR